MVQMGKFNTGKLSFYTFCNVWSLEQLLIWEINTFNKNNLISLISFFTLKLKSMWKVDTIDLKSKYNDQTRGD